MIGDLFHLAPTLPQGFRYHPDLLTEAEERELAGHLEGLDFAAVIMRVQVEGRRA